MNYGLYLSAAALGIQEYRQQVTANNLANVNTTSFKRDVTTVRSRPPAPEERNLPWYVSVPILDEVEGGLRNGSTHTDFAQGPMVHTGGELDVALEGEGFFAVEADGGKLYSRDGRFARDAEGYLVTSAGQQRVLDETGRTILLPVGKVSFDRQGFIRVNGEPQGRVGITDFRDPAVLRKVGDNAYAAGAAQTTPAKAQLRHEYVEGSGVEPTRALIDMLTAQRTYDASAKMIQLADSMLGKAVNEIARMA
ncbi:MAG: flagellar hook-basal body protein [Planctomycetes bacterium]|nr:flagellar hook-basal body protein [Planctomycetota bacterium]